MVSREDWQNCAGLAAVRADVSNLVDWQKSQNGTLTEIKSLLNRLLLAVIALLAGVAGSLIILLVK